MEHKAAARALVEGRKRAGGRAVRRVHTFKVSFAPREVQMSRGVEKQSRKVGTAVSKL